MYSFLTWFTILWTYIMYTIIHHFYQLVSINHNQKFSFAFLLRPWNLSQTKDTILFSFVFSMNLFLYDSMIMISISYWSITQRMESHYSWIMFYYPLHQSISFHMNGIHYQLSFTKIESHWSIKPYMISFYIDE